MVISTKKFSEFASGGDLENSNTTVGLEGGTNVRFNNPWTFLASGTTASRPVPAASMYYRQRLNTSLQVYEYYDPISVAWVQMTTSGPTGVPSLQGTANQVLVNGSSGIAISGVAITLTTPQNIGATSSPTFVSPIFTSPLLGTPTSGVLTNCTGLPLTTGVTGNLPVTNLNSGTGAAPTTFWAGDGTWRTPAGGGTVNSGSLNQLAWYAANGDTVSGLTSINNGVLVTDGGSVPSISTTLPNSLAMGTPVSLTLTNAMGLPLTTGVIGNLPVTNLNSGTSASATTFWRGDGTWSTPGGTGVTSVTGTANRITSTGGTTPIIDISAAYVGQTSITTLGTITTGTWNGSVVGPIYGGTGLNTISQGGLIYGSASNVYSILTKDANATRYLANTGSSNNPAWDQVNLANGVTGNLPVTNLNSGTSASSSTFWRGDGTWAAPSGSGTVNSGLINQVAWYAGAGTAVSGLTTANSGVLVTSAGGVPSISTTLPSGLTIPGFSTSVFLVASGTASSSAAVNLTGLTGYNEYMVFYNNVIPATNAANLNMLVSTNNGGAYDTSAIYSYVTINALSGVIATATTNGGTSYGVMANLAFTAALGGAGQLILNNPAGANNLYILNNAVFINSASTLINATTCGRYGGAATVNAIQFSMSSGNITSGSFYVYGVK